MARLQRLTNADFRHMRPRERVSGAYFTLTVAPHDKSGAHLACVVSKKVSAKATARNLIKRRCRAALQTVAMPYGNHAFVLTAKKSAHGASYADVSADIAALFARLGR